MNIMRRNSLYLALLALSPLAASASTSYGDLNNFDAVNDTGRECRGFEIEIVGARSTDVTYTYDWNHYGPPRITEDTTDPAKPRVFIRYESPKNPDGSWVAGARTDVPTQVLQPTDGHFCTDPTNYSFGCEHFGVGFYGNPAAISYHWLQEGSPGTLVQGPAVNVGTPSFAYVPPAPAQPAQVVAVIPAPVAPNPAGEAREFGEPTWVKVIKTTTHNANPVALEDLVSAEDANGNPRWQNDEPAEVETEWKLLQINNLGNVGAKDELAGNPDDMGDGSEVVTRRYEFYNYVRYVSAAGASPGDPLVDSQDGETGEAMCSEVDPTTDPADPNYLHGVAGENNVAVTDPNGDTYYIDCSAQVVVGDYVGAQMVGFDADAPLGLVGNLADGEAGTPYTPRTVVVGGNTPYSITVSPPDGLPPGMTIGDYTAPDSPDVAHGVLSGNPQSGGSFDFTVEATDADGVTTGPKAYHLVVAGGAIAQWNLSVGVTGTGGGTISGGGIDCGVTCAAKVNDGASVSLSALADADSVFTAWGDACSGNGNCDLTLTADTYVSATFTLKTYDLSVSKTGAGTGTVSGNGIDCGTVCSVALDAHTPVHLSAAPSTDSLFTGWSGDCTGSGSCDTTMEGARNVTANFALAPTSYTLTVTKSGSGNVTSTPKAHGAINCGSSCVASFGTGSTVTLTAKPKAKHAFLGWSGDCTGTSPTCTVQMSGTRSVGATFN